MGSPKDPQRKNNPDAKNYLPNVFISQLLTIFKIQVGLCGIIYVLVFKGHSSFVIFFFLISPNPSVVANWNSNKSCHVILDKQEDLSWIKEKPF